MKFALFFLGEYTHMITTSFLVVALFFGGWLFPWIAEPGDTGVVSIIIKLVVYAVKMSLFIAFFMLVRWTIPRFRFDQLMGLAWKVMMPLALLNLVGVMIVKHYRPLGFQSPWLLLPFSIVVLLVVTYLTLFMPRPKMRGSVVYVRGQPVAASVQQTNNEG
jgi:NADH-quinone oxidoreductase subunit H